MRHRFKNINDVVNAWECGTISNYGACGNVFFEIGRFDVIYSYGPHYPIARAVSRNPKRIALVNSTRFSITTTRHKSIVLIAICSWDIVISCPNPMASQEHTTNLKYFVQKARETWEKAARAKKNGPYLLNEYQQHVRDCSKYCKIFHIKNPLRSKPNKVIADAMRAAEERARVFNERRAGRIGARRGW